ncbi:MAG: Uroporphyrinogen deCOase protein [Bacteroidetes bacterium]|nr:Uroporphyrinogen deCOase protein [Bacteroidota bacterium]
MRRTGKPDRVPFEISWGAFTPSLMEVYKQRTGSTLDPAEYFDFDTRLVNLDATRTKTDFTRWFSEPPLPNAVWDEWGYGALRGSMEHFLEYRYHPLAGCSSVEQIEQFPWPDVDADYRFEGVARATRAFQERGYAVAGELYLTIFETAWLLRGMQNLLWDFYRNEDIAHAIFDTLTEIRVRQAVKYARIGVDILRLGDDVATQKGPMMGLDLYRKFLKERTRRIITAAKKVKPDLLVFMHCDGAVAEFIPEYIDIGVDILNPIQPECNDLSEIGRKYSDRISFWGGIGTQTTMPFGTPQEVRAKVREVKTQLGSGGGLLLAPSHILEPEVPWENVLAFVEAARDARN